MTLIVGILFTIIFYSLTAQSIKKYPVAYYLGMYAWTGLVVCYYNMGYYRYLPTWFNDYFMKIFARGIFATATFMIVMFLGTVTKHNDFSKKLMSIRGEMSIIGSLLVISQISSKKDERKELEETSKNGVSFFHWNLCACNGALFK